MELQGSSGGIAIYNLNLNKQFAEQRGSLGFGVENFLMKEFVIRNELKTTINQESRMALRNFGMRVNLSYRIGKLSTDNQRRRRRGVTNDDSMQGVDNTPVQN